MPSEGSPAAPGQTGSGEYLVKIALGSHLIEAVVDEMIPEGSKLTLEVLKLADDTLVLKLLEVDSSGRTVQDASARQSQGLRPDQQGAPDIADLSSRALEVLTGRTSVDSSRSSQIPPDLKLVDSPAWASLPKNVAQVLRAAIAEDFIDPAGFTAKLPEAQAAIGAALDGIEKTIANAGAPADGESGSIIESIQALAKTIRSILNSLPDSMPRMDESAARIGQSLLHLSTTFSATSGSPAQLNATPSSAQLSQESLLSTLSPQEAASSDEAAVTAKQAGDSASRQDSASQSTATASRDADTTAQSAKAAAASGKPAIVAVGDQAKPVVQPPIAQSLPPAASKPVAPSLAAAEEPAVSAGPIGGGDAKPGAEATSRDAASQQAQKPNQATHPARDMLLALRTLMTLTSILARRDGLTIEQSAELGRHAGRISAVSDAWEGTILTPMLTRSLDVPDAIPRLLLTLLFPGGDAQIAVLQTDKDTKGRDQKETGSGEGEGHYAGVIRLNTSGLGQIRVGLDYREVDDAPRVGGKFIATDETVDIIAAGLPSLERSLAARGISSDGFRVIEPSHKRSEPGETPTGRSGGLDIHV